MKKVLKPFTPIDNDFLDYNHNLKPSERVIYIFILRMTDGFKRRRKYKIANKEIQEATNIKKITPIIKSLEKKGWIKIDRNNGGYNTYEPFLFPSFIEKYDSSDKSG